MQYPKPKVVKWDGTENTIKKYPRSIALGIFDGVHVGHRSVIYKAAGLELEDGTLATSAVFTFSQPSWALPKSKRRDTSTAELMSDDAKKAVFSGMGIDEWIKVDFELVQNYTPQQFVDAFLYKTLDARRVCCGFNYRFGKNGKGDANLLKKLCANHDIETIVVDPIQVDGKTVSATVIRESIIKGEVEKAARLLGRPFMLDFEVISGQKLGRVMGTPTINQPLPPKFIHPKFGVYASCVEVDNKTTHGVTNIGVRPTVNEKQDEQHPLAETWIPDYTGDLYGEHVPVCLVKYLRQEHRFDNIDELKKQIHIDDKSARQAVLGKTGQKQKVKAVLFDFDDTLQDRVRAYTSFATWFCNKYFKDLAPEEKENRIKEMVKLNKGGYVDYKQFFSQLIENWKWTNSPSINTLYIESQFRFAEHVTLFPKVESTIKKLREKSVIVGVITNGPSLLQNRKLDVSGLRPLLDIVVVSGDENVHKPDAEIFRRTAARLGVACQSCIYVGDHPINDIVGAKNANMVPVFTSQAGHTKKPVNTLEIKNITEILNHI